MRQFEYRICDVFTDTPFQGNQLAIWGQSSDRLLGVSKSLNENLSPLRRFLERQVALDTLSIVAYRQPITRQEVDSLRGAASMSVLRQLVRLGLIAVQRGDGAEGEALYGTTSRFLKLFQLGSLDDLPRTQDLQKL